MTLTAHDIWLFRHRICPRVTVGFMAANSGAGVGTSPCFEPAPKWRDAAAERDHGLDTYTAGGRVGRSRWSSRHRRGGSAISRGRNADGWDAAVRGNRGCEAVQLAHTSTTTTPAAEFPWDGQVGRQRSGNHRPVHLGGQERRQPDDRGRTGVPDLVHESDLPQHALHADLQVAQRDRRPVLSDPRVLQPAPVEPRGSRPHGSWGGRSCSAIRSDMWITGGSVLSFRSCLQESSCGSRLRLATSTSINTTGPSSGRFCSSASRTCTTLSWTSGW